MSAVKLCWLDVRATGEERAALLEEAVHQGVDAVVAEDPAELATLPPTVRKVLLPDARHPWEDVGDADLVLLPPGHDEARVKLTETHPGVVVGSVVEVVDAATLDAACAAAAEDPWTLVFFRDPTKIPLEIVLAATAAAEGRIVVSVTDVPDAQTVLGVLEAGPDGVLLPGRGVGDATALVDAARARPGHVELVELEVRRTAHYGMGERACVDTCSHLRRDEGILVGSHSKGLVLCVSETHPLPYMPTRPFRVNAGALHSYVLCEDGRTQYLSELTAGSRVQAVDVAGRSRVVTVGRVKIETRPLLGVDAVAPDGRTVNLVLQEDWHVRVLGPGAAVLNSTMLRPGDRVLGHLPTADRHVGYAIDEFCLEQ